jgi:hypothetical protein
MYCVLPAEYQNQIFNHIIVYIVQLAENLKLNYIE